MKLQWFNKYPTFLKQLKEKVEQMEADDSDFSPTLADCVRGLEDNPRRLRKWGKLLSYIQKFLAQLKIEFEAYEADTLCEIREELVQEYDVRKAHGKPSIALTEAQVKERLRRNPEHRKYLMQIATVQYYYDYVERNGYWAAKATETSLVNLVKFAMSERRDS